MHTLFDYISHVYAVQYGLALISIVGFILLCELFKPRPFEGLRSALAEDLRFVKGLDKAQALGSLRAAALAPVYFLVYCAAIPVLFVHGTALLFSKVLVFTTSAGWSPVRAYFAGRARGAKSTASREEERQGDGT